jgi:diacylglycerol kinase
VNAQGTAHAGGRERAFRILALTIAVVLVVGLGLAVPGLGLVVAAGFAFTAYRNDRAVRRALLALGAAVTVAAVLLAVISHVSGGTALHHGKPVRVHAP